MSFRNLQSLREEEEEYTSHINWEATTHYCSGGCGENISYTEEVFVAVVAVTMVTDTGLLFPPLKIQMEHGMEDFLYEPCFVCLQCWEESEETLRGAKENDPPVEDAYAVCECSICASGIRDGELLGCATFGEIHLSKRSPDGRNSDTFEGMDPNPILFCITCLNTLNQDVIDALWNMPDHGLITQNDECIDGLYYRCWRHGCNPKEGCMADCEAG